MAWGGGGGHRESTLSQEPPSCVWPLVLRLAASQRVSHSAAACEGEQVARGSGAAGVTCRSRAAVSGVAPIAASRLRRRGGQPPCGGSARRAAAEPRSQSARALPLLRPRAPRGAAATCCGRGRSCDCGQRAPRQGHGCPTPRGRRYTRGRSKLPQRTSSASCGVLCASPPAAPTKAAGVHRLLLQEGLPQPCQFQQSCSFPRSY